MSEPTGDEYVLLRPDGVQERWSSREAFLRGCARMIDSEADPRRPVRHFCDHFIEATSESDPWGGTFCKLFRGHAGEHSAHYPAEACPVLQALIDRGHELALEHGW